MRAYNTHTPAERQDMLEAIGVASMEELFRAIPQKLRLASPLSLPEALPEWELQKHMHHLASRNATARTHLNFLGAGTYEHYIPAVIDAVLSRGEFLTSYTPYQPEMSQGLLQALHEYQQCMSAITGLEVVNSSCYDGATALAEAAWMCCAIRKARKRPQVILASETLWQEHREVLEVYMGGRNVAVHTVPSDAATGQLCQSSLKKMLKEHQPDGFLFQTPNAFGVLEDIAAITQICKEQEVLSVVSYHPLLSGLFTPPGKLGADIVAGSGQPLGIPMRAGGSGLGFLATHKIYRKFMPGRLVGKVTDIKERLAYALVYEDREQHVARERATSNICSNQALNAIRAALYLSLLGEKGVQDIAALNARKAHYLSDALTQIPGVKLARSGAFFNEFCLELPKPVATVQKALLKQGIFAGEDISSHVGKGKHGLLLAVTEVRSKAELDTMIKAVREALC